MPKRTKERVVPDIWYYQIKGLPFDIGYYSPIAPDQQSLIDKMGWQLIKHGPFRTLKAATAFVGRHRPA